MGRLLAAAVAAVAAVASSAAAGEPDAVALSRPSSLVYTERDGLPQATIHAVSFDRDGYLWVGTQDGAARFNGRAWSRVDMPDRLVSNFVRAVLPARDGSLWFGREEGGLVRFRGGEATVFDRADGLPASRVNHLLEAADGTVWAATHGGGVARFTGPGFAKVAGGLPDLRVWRLLEGRDRAGARRLLAACEGGVAALRGDGTWESLDLGRPLAGVSANSLLETGEGAARALWVGTFGAGLFRVTDAGVTKYGPGQGLGSRLVTSLAATVGPDGAPVVWAGTRDAGVHRLEGGAFERVPLGDGMNEVYALSAGDRAEAGTLWVGTRLAGLARVQDAAWATVDRATGLPGDQVFCFLEAPGPGGREAVWVGTSSGVAILERGRLTVPGPEAGLPRSPVRSLVSFAAPGGKPEVWATLIGAGLWRFDGRRWWPVDAGPAFRSADAGVLAVAEGSAGRPELWVGTEKSGLGRFADGRWSALGVGDGLPSDSVLSLLATAGPEGPRLWVGTRGGGLAELAGGRVAAVHDRGTGLPNNNVLSLAEVAVPGGRREIWAGTRGGVARRPLGTTGAWAALSTRTRPALPNDNVFLVAQEPGGAVYLGTNRGVARLADARPWGAETEVVAFGTNEGLPSAACNWGSLVDRKGRVWVATAAGAAVHVPGRDGAGRNPHPLVVERLEVDGELRPNETPFRLTPRQRNVAFEFALLAFHGESLVRYRTQLAGWERDPSGWVASHRREFTNLPPGAYAFRVWGRDADGVVTGPVEARFEVSRSWFTQPAALVLWSLLAAGLGLLAVRFRERTLRHRAEELEALVRLRTRELEEARDAAEAATESKGRFLAHMSHEVRTPLNAILGYAEILSEDLRERGVEDLLADLEKISRAARQQLSLVNEALDHSKLEAGGAELHLTEFDAGRLVREAAETAWPLMRRGHNRLETSGLETLGTAFTDEGKLRQVLLNLLSNASRFTENGLVSVEASRADGTLAIRVSDTGAGMTPEQLERVFTPYAQASPGTSARYGGTGLGLVISRGYCELMRGALEVTSEPGRGTTFTVKVPARLERRGSSR